MKDKMLTLQEQIKEKEKEIKATEILLDKLNKEVDELYKEYNDLEAMKLFKKAKDRGLTVEETLELLR